MLRRYLLWLDHKTDWITAPLLDPLFNGWYWLTDAWHYREAARQLRTRPLEFLEPKHRFAIRRFQPNHGFDGTPEERRLRHRIMDSFEMMKPTADVTRH